MIKKKYTASISKDGNWFVAQCLEVDVASQGKTEKEALQNLREALELHFEDPQATDKPEIRQIEIELSVA